MSPARPGRSQPGNAFSATPTLAGVPAQWVSRATPPPLEPGQVHVWAVALDLDDDALAGLRHDLSEREDHKAQRLCFDIHRRRYVASRGLLRRLIGQYLGVPAARIEFRYGPRGKPFLADGRGSPLEFNATDSGGQSMFAFARNMELGIDLECVPRDVEHDRIAERHFAGAEVGALRAFPDADRQQAFLACWTRKEAYGKAEGVGIRYPLDSVCLCEDLTVPEATVSTRDSLSGRTWALRQFRPDFPGVATLVTSEACDDIHYFRLQAESAE